MRYLAQLARETTARVVPRRAPSWTPALPLAEANAIVEWTGIDTTSRRTTQLAPDSNDGPAPTPSSSRPRSEDDEQRPFPQTHAHLIKSEQQPASPSPSERQKQAAQESAATVFLRETVANETTTTEPVQQARIPRDDAHTPVLLPAPVTFAPLAQTAGLARNSDTMQQRPRDLDATTQPREAPTTSPREPALTLPAIFAEMARRQERMEAEYREEQASSRGSFSRRLERQVEPSTTQPPQREPDHVRLNIGSIVVQLEPPPKPPVTPLVPAPRRAPRDSSSNRWARSFADR